MAAFSSFQQQLDAPSSSFFLPNSPSPSPSPSSTINKMCALFHDPNNALSPFHQHNHLHHGSVGTTTPPSLSPSPSPSPLSNNHNNKNNDDSQVLNAAKNKNSMDSSISVVTHKYHQTNQKHPLPFCKKRKSKEGSCPNSAQSKDMREGKGKKQKKMKAAGEEAPTGFIHVRARRGQATDSHSLAERVRRERISERMKLLQALVPGCDKVTGKALMLDEIINYVQSLQNQVEFLSMKLASVNPIFYDFGMDLESFMVRPDQNLNSLASPLPAGMQECSPTTANTYHVLDNSLLLHQSQIPNALPQGDRQQVLWEVDEQRQKIINQSGINNNLFSFPLM